MALSSLSVLLMLSTLLSTSESNNQVCDAWNGYDEAQCGIQASSSSKILIKGGTVVNAHHQEIADVYVENGIIVAVKPNIKVGDDVTVLDATGKYVMPGGIDPHTHLAMEFMGTETIDDFFSGQAAALAGGTTMHIDFVIPVNGSLSAGFKAYERKAKNSCMDYGFHMTITKWDEVVAEEMEIMVKEKGINSFKFFMAYKGILMVNDELLLEGFKRCKSFGALAMVHAENGDAVFEGQKRMIELGITGPEGHSLSRPPMLEGEATSRAIRLASFVNVPLYVVHVMSIDAMEEIAKARKSVFATDSTRWRHRSSPKSPVPARSSGCATARAGGGKGRRWLDQWKEEETAVGEEEEDGGVGGACGGLRRRFAAAIPGFCRSASEDPIYGGFGL